MAGIYKHGWLLAKEFGGESVLCQKAAA